MVALTPLENVTILNTPRRVMKYVLIWCSSGEVVVRVDENVFTLQAHRLVTITSGQVHSIDRCVDATGYVLEFTLDFFCKDDNDIELVFHNGLFCHFAMNEVIAVGNHTVMEEHLDFIGAELAAKPFQYLISVRARIQLMLIEINRAKVARGDEIWKPGALFLKFLEAVRSGFQHQYPLSHYAGMLGTTELKLNEQAKMHAGKTAQNVIYGLIAAEAKRLLMYEDLSVKEVAARLGFNDPFYFSNFFKKHAGTSPRDYQQRHRR